MRRFMAISDYAPQETTVAPPADPSAAGHREFDVEESFDRIVDQGRARTRRPWVDVLATGAVGDIEVGFGVLALLSVEMMTGSKLLGGLAFSIGFIALLLGHSELFTEGFLIPVTVVAAGEARLRHLVRFWVGTLLGNLAGGLLLAYLVDKAFPDLQEVANSTAASYINAGLNLRTFCLAVLAGGAITLLTRMHNGTDEMLPKLVASVSTAFLLAGVTCSTPCWTHCWHSRPCAPGVHRSDGWTGWPGSAGRWPATWPADCS